MEVCVKYASLWGALEITSGTWSLGTCCAFCSLGTCSGTKTSTFAVQISTKSCYRESDALPLEGNKCRDSENWGVRVR